MRDLLFSGLGLFVGGAVGVGATLALELVVVATVAVTVHLTSTPDDGATPAAPPVAAARVAPSRAPQAAAPGQLQLFTMAAVTPLVDGVPAMAFDGTSYVAELDPGTHRVQLLDMLGRETAAIDVEVVSGQRS